MFPVDKVNLLESLAPDRKIAPVSLTPKALTQEHKQPIALTLILELTPDNTLRSTFGTVSRAHF
jgi:hypothetical protein